MTASAIGTLVSIAGQERVAIGIGSGFTGRYTMGQKPLKWSYVRSYVSALRALLRGEQVEWEGGVMQMMHPEGFAPPRPIEVPFVIAAAGPKGVAAAHELGDGVFGAPFPIGGFDWSVVLTFGTVLDDGEDPGSPRVLAAGGPGAPVIFHYAMEHGQLGLLPNGEQWAAAYADVPKKSLHLALHDRHLIAVNERDRPFVTGERSGVAAGADAGARVGTRARVGLARCARIRADSGRSRTERRADRSHGAESGPDARPRCRPLPRPARHRSDRAAFRRRTHPFAVHDSARRPEVLARFLDGARVCQEGACNCFASLLQRYFREPTIEVSGLSQEVLLLWGTADPTHRYSDRGGLARALAASGTRVTSRELPATGHHLELENPRGVAEAIREFLGR